MAVAALLVVGLAGCDSGYRLGAQDWQADLTSIQQSMASARTTALADPVKLTSNPAALATLQNDLTQAKAKIEGLKAKLPASGPDYHQELVTGLDELAAACDAGLAGVASKDRAKLLELNTKAQSGEQHVKTWETSVRGG